MLYLITTLSLLTLPNQSVPLTWKDQPLLDVVELRLSLVDQLTQRRENRAAVPTDRWFRFRFYSSSLVEGLQPGFPAGLLGAIPLLEHSDVRVQCAMLYIIEKWLDKPPRNRTQRPSNALSDAEWQRVRLTLLNQFAHPNRHEDSAIVDEMILRIFPRLIDSPLTQAEEALLLSRLKSDDPRRRRQIVQLFLSIKPLRLPVELRAPLKELLAPKSTEQSRLSMCLNALSSAPPELQGVLRDVLKRHPHGGSARRLAMLLARSGVRSPEMVPGLVAAFCQEVPARGGMMGRGGMSFYVPDSPNRYTILQEKRLARKTLMTLPVRQPRTVLDLMKLLDSSHYDARELGIASIRRFGSDALIAVPKLLTMDTTENRPKGRIVGIGWTPGLRFAVFDAVTSILTDTWTDIRCGSSRQMLLSAGQWTLRRLAPFVR